MRGEEEKEKLERSNRKEGQAEGSRKKFLPLPLGVFIRSWVLPLSVLMSFSTRESMRI